MSAIYIDVRCVSTYLVSELILGQAVLFCCMTTVRTALACICGRSSKHLTATPELLILELATYFISVLIQYGTVGTGFYPDIAPRLADRTRCGLGHVAGLQIPNDYHCVVFAGDRCDFVKVIPADICDTGMQSLYFAFLPLPVVAEFDLAT